MSRSAFLLAQQKEIAQAQVDHFCRCQLASATPEQIQAIRHHGETYYGQVFDSLEKWLRDRGDLKDDVGNERHGKENATPRSAKKEKKESRKNREKEGEKEKENRLRELRERRDRLRAERDEMDAERSRIAENLTKKLKDDPSFTDVSGLEAKFKELRSLLADQAERDTEQAQLVPRPVAMDEERQKQFNKIQNIRSSLEETEVQPGLTREQQSANSQESVPPVVAEFLPLLNHIDRKD